MTYISSHHLSFPLYGDENNPDQFNQYPDTIIHVHITVIRLRFRSALDEHDHRMPHRQSVTTLPRTNRSAESMNQPKNPHRNFIHPLNDPRVRDPRFREKYTLN